MKNKKTFIVVLLLIAVLLLGIGYAMSNKTLTINGSATATPDDANFVVRFAETPAPSVSDGTKVTAERTDDKTATLNVTGLTAKGDKVTATYTIENASVSADLSANLAAEVSKNTKSDYFSVTTEFAKTTIAKGETTTITVTVELLKTPVDAEVSSDITVTLTASPVQPS